MELHEEGKLVHWETIVLRQLPRPVGGLVVAHGNTGMEVDALSARDRDTADDIIRGRDLRRGGGGRSCDSHVTYTEDHITMSGCQLTVF